MACFRELVSVAPLHASVKYAQLSTAIDIAMMAPMLGLTSDPAELGFVLSRAWFVGVRRLSCQYFAFCRVRLGVGFAITGMTLIFAFSTASLNVAYITKALVDWWVSRSP